MKPSNFDYTGWLQRRVGFSLAGAAVLVVVLQVLTILLPVGRDAQQTPVLLYIGVLAVSAALLLWSGLSCRIWGRYLQVAVFVGTAFLSAATSSAGNLTSLLFLAIAIMLYAEYEEDYRGLWWKVAILLSIHLGILAVSAVGRGPQGFVAIGLVATVLAVGVLGVVVVSIFAARHSRYRHQQQALEAAVAERTRELQSAVESRDTALQELQAALNERETLMQELHHRSKNNLQLVKSLIDLSESQSEEPALKAALEKASNRILSIALVHEQLYVSERFGDVELRGYVDTLASAIGDSQAARVTTDTYGAEGITVGLDFAVPFGLVLTELISNAFEHAKPPDGTEVHVGVTLSTVDGQVRCVVADNGAADPDSIDFDGADSMGLTIARGLARQLEGTLDLEAAPEGGVRSVLTAPLPPAPSTTSE